MTRAIVLLVLFALASPVASFAETEMKSKAEQITFTGRVQAQWRHSTIEGEPSNEFLIRRARATIKVKINDWWSGVVQPDFGGGEVVLKDAYAQMKLSDNLAVTMGQFKRRFDLFELTSSTQILVIERDGRIGRTRIPSLSRFTEKLGYSDRDIGLYVSGHDSGKRFLVEAGLTNGSGADASADMGEKAYQGRLTVQPLEDQPLAISGGVSVKPYETEFAGTDSADVKYAAAFEGAVEWGKYDGGPHVQAGFVLGDNWDGVFASYDPTSDFALDPPTFYAVQGILTYNAMLPENDWFQSFEPLVRVSFADPDTDADNDGGILVTPGFNVFTKARNRLSVNVDVFVPQNNDLDTEASVKAQSWLYW